MLGFPRFSSAMVFFCFCICLSDNWPGFSCLHSRLSSSLSRRSAVASHTPYQLAYQTCPLPFSGFFILFFPSPDSLPPDNSSWKLFNQDNPLVRNTNVSLYFVEKRNANAHEIENWICKTSFYSGILELTLLLYRWTSFLGYVYDISIKGLESEYSSNSKTQRARALIIKE